ncbi:hypothetical protein LCGC14_2838990 [marine sediment metagenome]|uniref:Uncharacterized protein n=1 Tax=marine sediment metagenome TaxID=412755 RepID=A0A0F8YYH4_9ZZZZ
MKRRVVGRRYHSFYQEISGVVTVYDPRTDMSGGWAISLKQGPIGIDNFGFYAIPDRSTPDLGPYLPGPRFTDRPVIGNEEPIPLALDIQAQDLGLLYFFGNQPVEGFLDGCGPPRNSGHKGVAIIHPDQGVTAVGHGDTDQHAAVPHIEDFDALAMAVCPVAPFHSTWTLP